MPVLLPSCPTFLTPHPAPPHPTPCLILHPHTLPTLSPLAALTDELSALQADPQYSQLAYLTQADIRSLPIFDASTVIAVRAPDGTRMEVPGR